MRAEGWAGLQRRDRRRPLSSRDTLRSLARIAGRDYAIATGSGTVALLCALKALGVSRDSEIVLPSIVCPSVVVAVLRAGGLPVFCDVHAGDLNMDPESLRSVMTPQTSVVIPVHSFGAACDLPRISAAAAERGAVVLEDFAQGFGNTSDQGPLGAAGAISITSFGREKLLEAGGGGALFTNDPALHREAVRVLDGLPHDAPKWASGALSRLRLAWAMNSRSTLAFRRRVAAAIAARSQQADRPMSDEAVMERVRGLAGKRLENAAARRSRLSEVVSRTRDLPGLQDLFERGAVLTMATFVLARRPASRIRWRARARGLFFLYRPLHALNDNGGDLSVSAALDGRLANISLSPARDAAYLDAAVSALRMCLGGTNA